MKDLVLEKIKNSIIIELSNTYGYCSCADNDYMAMLNSDDKSGNEIRIKIISEPLNK